MTAHAPVVSGPQHVRVLATVGWDTVGQRGRHVRLKKPGRSISIIVPLRRELKRGTLAAILRDVDLDYETLRMLL